MRNGHLAQVQLVPSRTCHSVALAAATNPTNEEQEDDEDHRESEAEDQAASNYYAHRRPLALARCAARRCRLRAAPTSQTRRAEGARVTFDAQWGLVRSTAAVDSQASTNAAEAEVGVGAPADVDIRDSCTPVAGGKGHVLDAQARSGAVHANNAIVRGNLIGTVNMVALVVVNRLDEAAERARHWNAHVLVASAVRQRRRPCRAGIAVAFTG
mmetsp:Transcript_4229/g.15583  ORF Transcript_4229/g.15583 Transcript_4229/m.15583 type:complete len:213 (-) Transcript_4229:5598-6236(-)